MQHRKKRPIFFDLDETLIYAGESGDELPIAKAFKQIEMFDYRMYLRPEAREMLQLCRSGGREVYLFTHANFHYAREVSRAMDLGFDESTIFSFSMILNCRKGLCPDAVLIENKPPEDEDTQVKMEALGIPAEQVWMIPSFEPPKFAGAKLFLAGLEWRLSKLHRS